MVGNHRNQSPNPSTNMCSQLSETPSAMNRFAPLSTQPLSGLPFIPKTDTVASIKGSIGRHPGRIAPHSESRTHGRRCVKHARPRNEHLTSAAICWPQWHHGPRLPIAGGPTKRGLIQSVLNITCIFQVIRIGKYGTCLADQLPARGHTNLVKPPAPLLWSGVFRFDH